MDPDINLATTDTTNHHATNCNRLWLYQPLSVYIYFIGPQVEKGEVVLVSDWSEFMVR